LVGCEGFEPSTY